MPTSKKAAPTSKPIDAIEFLKADHRAAEELFEKFEKARTSASKDKISHEVCVALAIHTTIEEEIFYPALKGKIEKSMLDEAYVEHDGAKLMIAEILAGNAEEAFFDAKVKVLSEEIKHHVKEEERRGGMFSEARKTDVDMKELGARMMARKEELEAEYEANEPVLETHSLSGAAASIGHAA